MKFLIALWMFGLAVLAGAQKDNMDDIPSFDPAPEAPQPIVESPATSIVESPQPIVESPAAPIAESPQPIVESPAASIVESPAVPIAESLEPIVESPAAPIVESPAAPIPASSSAPIAEENLVPTTSMIESSSTSMSLKIPALSSSNVPSSSVAPASESTSDAPTTSLQSLPEIVTSSTVDAPVTTIGLTEPSPSPLTPPTPPTSEVLPEPSPSPLAPPPIPEPQPSAAPIVPPNILIPVEPSPIPAPATSVILPPVEPSPNPVAPVPVVPAPNAVSSAPPSPAEKAEPQSSSSAEPSPSTRPIQLPEGFLGRAVSQDSGSSSDPASPQSPASPSNDQQNRSSDTVATTPNDPDNNSGSPTSIKPADIGLSEDAPIIVVAATATSIPDNDSKSNKTQEGAPANMFVYVGVAAGVCSLVAAGLLYRTYQKNETSGLGKSNKFSKQDPQPELDLEEGIMELERPYSEATTTRPFHGERFDDSTMRSEMSGLSDASSIVAAPVNRKSFMMVGQSEALNYELTLPVATRVKPVVAKPWLRLSIFGMKSTEEEQPKSAFPDTPVSFNMDALNSYKDLPAMYTEASGERSPPPMMDLPPPPTSMSAPSDSKHGLTINTQAGRLSALPNRVSFAAKNQTAVFSPASTYSSFASSPLAKDRNSLSTSDDDEVRVVSGAYSTVSVPFSEASEDEDHILATSPDSAKFKAGTKDAFEIADHAKAFAEQAVYYSPRFSVASNQSFGSSL